MRSDATFDRALIIFTIIPTIFITTLHHFTITNLCIIPCIIAADISITCDVMMILFSFLACFKVLSSNSRIFLCSLSMRHWFSQFRYFPGRLNLLWPFIRINTSIFLPLTQTTDPFSTILLHFISTRFNLFLYIALLRISNFPRIAIILHIYVFVIFNIFLVLNLRITLIIIIICCSSFCLIFRHLPWTVGCFSLVLGLSVEVGGLTVLVVYSLCCHCAISWRFYY